MKLQLTFDSKVNFNVQSNFYKILLKMEISQSGIQNTLKYMDDLKSATLHSLEIIK